MFKLTNQETLKNLDVELFEFEHEKTKAKHIHIKADDVENAFICGFKTLPYSDNGIKHIIEHSVLEGSKNFPLKDLFTAMSKQSLNSFMNATTSTEYTDYLFATPNKKDFFNLMTVYTDAVFFPLLKKETFLQEGWRYEFEEENNPNSNLKFNGVVFNEMKGAMASIHTNVYYAFYQALYPNIERTLNSGGLPKNIPDLTYQEFCDYHKEYYHPSNAVFLTYGDIDFSEIQEKLETLVLDKFDYKEITIKDSPAEIIKEEKDVSLNIPYAEDDYDENHHFFKLINIPNSTDSQHAFNAMFIGSLIYSGSESPLLKALQDSKLFKSNSIFITDNDREMFLTIGGAGIDLNNIEKAKNLINSTLLDIAENGISQSKINKELHQYELTTKDKFTGSYPIGLSLLNQAMSAALAKDSVAVYLTPEDALESLKESLKDPSFIQNFVKENFINHNFKVNATFKASKTAHQQNQQALTDKLENLQKTLTDEDKQNILQDLNNLHNYQITEDNSVKLPELKVADIPLDFKFKELETAKVNNKEVFAFNLNSTGLTYVSKSSFIKGFKASDVQYLQLYSALIHQFGYNDMNYQEANEYISSICSSISFNTSIVEDRFDSSKIYIRASHSSKMLASNKQIVAKTMDDFILNKNFDITTLQHLKERIKEIAHNKLSGVSNINSCIGTARELANASLSQIDTVALYSGGVMYDKFIINLAKNIDDEKVFEELINKFIEIDNKVKSSYKESVISIADKSEELEDSVNTFYNGNGIEDLAKHPIVFDLENYDYKAFLTDKIDTNFCLMSIPAPYIDHELAGAYFVLGYIITGDFMYKEIREKGGAYGGGASYKPHSEVFTLASWYDPNLSKTLEVFKRLPEWLQDESNFTQEEMEEGILQAIAAFDKPSTPIKRCVNALNRYFDEVTIDDLSNFRQNILKTDKDKIMRVINELILPSYAKASFAVTANKAQFNKENLDFKVLEF